MTLAELTAKNDALQVEILLASVRIANMVWWAMYGDDCKEGGQ